MKKSPISKIGQDILDLHSSDIFSSNKESYIDPLIGSTIYSFLINLFGFNLVNFNRKDEGVLEEKEINGIHNIIVDTTFGINMLRDFSNNKLESLNLNTRLDRALNWGQVILNTTTHSPYSPFNAHSSSNNTSDDTSENNSREGLNKFRTKRNKDGSSEGMLSDKMLMTSFYSLLSAVFVDSGCSLAAVRRVLYEIMIPSISAKDSENSLNYHFLKFFKQKNNSLKKNTRPFIDDIKDQEDLEQVLEFFDDWKNLLTPIFPHLESSFHSFLKDETRICRVLLSRKHVSILSSNRMPKDLYKYLDHNRFKVLGKAFYFMVYQFFFYWYCFSEEKYSNAGVKEVVIPIVQSLGLQEVLEKSYSVCRNNGNTENAVNEEKEAEELENYMRDTFWALIGASLVEKSIDEVYVNLHNLFVDVAKNEAERFDNPKSILIRKVQEMIKLKYNVQHPVWETELTGDDNLENKYYCNVYLENVWLGYGEGNSKGSAERNAAYEAVEKMNEPGFYEQFESEGRSSE